jgi:hypothetical protein
MSMSERAVTANKADGRSENHRCYYRVGLLDGNDVYWHPVTGYAWESIQDRQLIKVGDNQLREITWRSDDCFAQIVRDVEASYGRLREAMDANLRAHVDAIMEDMDFAEEAGRERNGPAATANASLVEAGEW